MKRASERANEGCNGILQQHSSGFEDYTATTKKIVILLVDNDNHCTDKKMGVIRVTPWTICAPYTI